jgi:hypothetical protein
VGPSTFVAGRQQLVAGQVAPGGDVSGGARLAADDFEDLAAAHVAQLRLDERGQRRAAGIAAVEDGVRRALQYGDARLLGPEAGAEQIERGDPAILDGGVGVLRDDSLSGRPD